MIIVIRPNPPTVNDFFTNNRSKFDSSRLHTRLHPLMVLQQNGATTTPVNVGSNFLCECFEMQTNTGQRTGGNKNIVIWVGHGSTRGPLQFPGIGPFFNTAYRCLYVAGLNTAPSTTAVPAGYSGAPIHHVVFISCKVLQWVLMTLDDFITNTLTAQNTDISISASQNPVNAFHVNSILDNLVGSGIAILTKIKLSTNAGLNDMTFRITLNNNRQLYLSDNTPISILGQHNLQTQFANAWTPLGGLPQQYYNTRSGQTSNIVITPPANVPRVNTPAINTHAQPTHVPIVRPGHTTVIVPTRRRRG